MPVVKGKAYGKLTSDQFRRLVRQLPELRKEHEGFQDRLRSARAEKLTEVLGEGVWWAPLYELPLSELLALLIYVLGDSDRIKVIAQLPDPQEALLRELEKPLIWNGGPGGAFSKAHVISLAMALQRNVLSIMVYRRSLSALVADVRGGDDGALFDAVRIDASAVSCPTIAARISRAVLLGEKRFNLRLINALKGPSRKHWAAYQDLRYSLAMLREMGVDWLSDGDLEHLLVDVLEVYPKTAAARKNLRKQYYESRKIKGL